MAKVRRIAVLAPAAAAALPAEAPCDRRVAGTVTVVRSEARELEFKPEIVVMPASDIARRDQADQRGWVTRGVCGVVASVRGGRITVSRRPFTGDEQTVVSVTSATACRRYAPGSVRQADAVAARASQIESGDEL